MFRDARSLTSGTRLAYDVCIVGAGAAGITLALSLRDAGLRVGLLESGGKTEDPDTQELSNGRMSGIKTWNPRTMRVRALGGTTARWAGWCRPLDPEDFEPRPHIPESGWPIGWEELVPWYERAHQRLALGDFLYDAEPVAAAAGMPLLMPESERIHTTFFQYSPPVRFGSAFEEELERAEDIEVLLWANLREVRLEAGLDRVSHLEVRTLDGVELRVEADRYVLALGGLENARVLLASNRQIDEGVANSSGRVGSMFMEHPHYYSAAAWVANGKPDLRFYTRHTSTFEGPEGDLRGIPILGVLKLRGSARANYGLPCFTAELAPAEFGSTRAETGPISADAMAGYLQGEAPSQSLVRLTLRVEQTPYASSRVTLVEDELDALGMPMLDLNWRVPDLDLSTLRTACELIGAELAGSGLGRLWTPHEDGRFTWNTQPGGHHMGTTRMSVRPEDGVVDADLRCHDVSNLYVVGASVFTTGGDANPTLTLVALAERLAAHLREPRGDE